ncbi:MAG: hypothetical protein SGJ11_09370 [Phycisphaerae bacterium]|nr:hypothetical protein [Phycisphaerae bacterium]
MPQETKQKFASSADHTSFTQGAVINDAQPDELRRALDEACDYRGDVTITTKDGRSVEGYLFDRRQGSTLATSFVRVLPAASQSPCGDEKVTIAYDEITSIAFSGKDTAAGKSWDNWVRRYAEKKLSGEAANIESEKLD